MNARKLLTAYVLLTIGPFLYSVIRHGLPLDAFSWTCISIGVLILVFLVRGSRAAWLLSFFGLALFLASGVGLLAAEGALTLEWLLVLLVSVLQLLILLTSEVREYIRRTSFERAIKAHRSW